MTQRQRPPEGVYPATGSDYYHHPDIWDEESAELWLARMNERMIEERGGWEQ